MVCDSMPGTLETLSKHSPTERPPLLMVVKLQEQMTFSCSSRVKIGGLLFGEIKINAQNLNIVLYCESFQLIRIIFMVQVCV